MLKSFFVMLGCGEDKGKLVFLRHVDGSMTGGRVQLLPGRDVENTPPCHSPSGA